MIDCDVEFGAFVPKVPLIYKDDAAITKRREAACCSCHEQAIDMAEMTLSSFLSMPHHGHMDRVKQL